MYIQVSVAIRYRMNTYQSVIWRHFTIFGHLILVKYIGVGRFYRVASSVFFPGEFAQGKVPGVVELPVRFLALGSSKSRT